MDIKDTKVIVGLSGGVDSSVAAWALKEQGYQVEGLFMKNWEEDDGTEYCTAKQDLTSATLAAETLDIPLRTANFSAEYWDNVFEHFLSEYRQHRIPNPDVLCNREIKFDAFLHYAKSLGADKIATGHYARLETSSGLTLSSTRLLKGLDDNKDQSYFLHALNTRQLNDCLFPIGHLSKPEVRTLAHKIGLPNFDRKDSTGVCFIGERRFKDFLNRYLPETPGLIVTSEDQVVGEHMGLLYYTLGQRKGLGLGGIKDKPEAAWYVADKRVDSNQLVVVQDPNHPLLMSSTLTAGQAHWINPDIVPGNHSEMRCFAKIRHRQADQPCKVIFNSDHSLEVTFDTPQRAINPGQYVVFYDNDYCLGGATIEAAQ